LKSSGERGWRETREESAKKFAKKGTKSTSVPQGKEEQTAKILKYLIRIERTMKKRSNVFIR
jgi:hypothetical protein